MKSLQLHSIDITMEKQYVSLPLAPLALFLNCCVFDGKNQTNVKDDFDNRWRWVTMIKYSIL